MNTPPPDDTRDAESRRAEQLRRLREMLDAVLPTNPFYGAKMAVAGVTQGQDVDSFDAYARLPFTTKGELSEDQDEAPPYGTNLTYPSPQYVRMHQTSGTTGSPLRWLDTEESWSWFGACWADVFGAAGVDGSERVFFPFSFGPFIGFWTAYEGARRIGAMALPGGAMSSEQRVRAIVEHKATVVVSTPTYALRLAEVAAEAGVDLASSDVRVTIHAGEPGASIPGTKRRIDEAWGATCFDHAGATEVGAWGFECEAHAGMHLNEAEFICEVIEPDTGDPADEGELVLTNLGRLGMPVIRYRTGDHVRLAAGPCPCGRTYRRIQGGVIGRIDDALLVRGVVVFPSAVESIVRRFPAVGEFAIHAQRHGELDQLTVQIESEAAADSEATTDAVAAALREALGLRVSVESVAVGSLPRFDLKARRVTDHRQQTHD
ncbi:phenylacetate--CoA ligase family protein [Candidatus Poribacteria bacterium]|nr:phenylacetate--CoA ligase family protein [Candidatus Poribacteria bacterium]